MPSAPKPALLFDALPPTAAAGCLVGLLAATWSGLWQQPPAGRIALVAAVGVLPALVQVTGVRRARLWAGLVAVAVAIVALGASVGSNPIKLVRGDGPTWSALGDILPSGFGNAATAPLPLSPDRAPALAALLVLVLAGAACLIAWQIVVSRRPLAGIIAATTGLAYRWTLVPPLRPVLTGVLTLIIALAAFRLAGPRRTTRANSGRTVLVGGMVIALALAGSIGADGAPASWWGWRDWTFGAGQGPTSLSLKQNYGPLIFPADPILVARVVSDEPIPLRMVALAGFDGTSFVPLPSTEPSHTALSPDARKRLGVLVTQRDRAGKMIEDALQALEQGVKALAEIDTDIASIPTGVLGPNYVQGHNGGKAAMDRQITVELQQRGIQGRPSSVAMPSFADWLNTGTELLRGRV